jgi:hypothetical protein
MTSRRSIGRIGREAQVPAALNGQRERTQRGSQSIHKQDDMLKGSMAGRLPWGGQTARTRVCSAMVVKTVRTIIGKSVAMRLELEQAVPGSSRSPFPGCW